MAAQFGAWVTLTHNSTGTCFIIHRLPAALQARTEGLRLKHDAGHTSAGSLRGDFEEAENAEEAPGAVHPIIHDHPVPGRQCLYLGRRQDAYVVGIAPDDNKALLDEISAAPCVGSVVRDRYGNRLTR